MDKVWYSEGKGSNRHWNGGTGTKAVIEIEMAVLHRHKLFAGGYCGMVVLLCGDSKLAAYWVVGNNLSAVVCWW